MAIFLTGCSSLPSAGVSNLCTLFDSKRSWFKQARKASDRWGVPVPILMAVIHQESRFDAKARPPRKKILWVFPGKRASSAFGYAQAQTSTWDWYQKSTGRKRAQRDRFKDAVDFVGWYHHQSNRLNNIKKTDALNLYLAYHEGHGGYSRRSYRQKPWLMEVARSVSQQAQKYNAQMSACH